jgi:hypothetical protein
VNSCVSPAMLTSRFFAVGSIAASTFKSFFA